MSGDVTEQDFRMPEFRGADPKDYERRADGKIVRKDRWERGFGRVIDILGERRGMSHRGYEIDDVLESLRLALGQSSCQMAEAMSAAVVKFLVTNPETRPVLAHIRGGDRQDLVDNIYQVIEATWHEITTPASDVPDHVAKPFSADDCQMILHDGRMLAWVTREGEGVRYLPATAITLRAANWVPATDLIDFAQRVEHVLSGPDPMGEIEAVLASVLDLKPQASGHAEEPHGL